MIGLPISGFPSMLSRLDSYRDIRPSVQIKTDSQDHYKFCFFKIYMSHFLHLLQKLHAYVYIYFFTRYTKWNECLLSLFRRLLNCQIGLSILAFSNFHVCFISHLFTPSSVSLLLSASQSIQRIRPRLIRFCNVFVSASPLRSGAVLRPAPQTKWVLWGGAGWLSTLRRVNLGLLGSSCLSLCSWAS